MESTLTTVCNQLGPFVDLAKRAGEVLADGIIKVVDKVFDNL